MGNVKWIKLDNDIFNNRKIRQIEKMPDGDTMIVIWLKLLTLAGHVNDGGFIYLTRDIPYTEQLLSTEFDRPLATVQMALRIFKQFGMIDLHDSILHVTNWEEYQNVEGMERIREQNRLRKQNQREREKQALLESHVTSRDSHATDIDKERDIEKESKSKRFTPPTFEEVKAYCLERQNGIDPQRFIDYQEARGWVLSNGKKMADWKATIRTWEQRNKVGASGSDSLFKDALRRTKK